MKKYLLFALVLVILAGTGLYAGGGSQKTGSSGGNATDASGGKTIKIGITWAHKNDSLFYGMEKAIKSNMEAKMGSYGISKIVWVDIIANDDAKKQATDIQDLITQKCDMIISYAFDSTAIGTSIQAARAAGIPFVMWDRDADPKTTQPDAFVGLDTTAQAYTTGVALFKKMKEVGITPTDVISVVGDLADQNALNRIAGLKKAADEYGVAIKQEVPSEWNADKALSGFSAAFLANPNCNTVFVASDFIFTPIQSVLEQAGKWIPNGKPGHVWIGSQDVFPPALQPIRDGYIDFDGAYDLDAMGKALAPIALDLLNGKKPAQQKTVVTGVVISKDNVDTAPNLWTRDYEGK